MSRRLKIGLALAVTVAVAMLLLRGEDRHGEAGADLLFPGLTDRLDEVAAVVVESVDERVELRHDGSGWIVADAVGYAADGARIRVLVLSLSAAEVVEAKTSRPERYAEIGVANLDVEGSRASRVSLLDAGGEVLAALLVGDGSGESSYVRRTGEARSYLVRPRIEAGGRPEQWRDRRLLEVERDAMERVAVTHEDGPPVEVAADGRGGFALAGVPDGRRVKYQYQVNDVATSWVGLRFEDVQRADDSAPASEWTMRLQLRSGLVVEGFESAPGTGWFRFRAYAADGSQDEDVGTRATALNERWSGWQYRLPQSVHERMFRPLEELVEPEQSGQPPADG